MARYTPIYFYYIRALSPMEMHIIWRYCSSSSLKDAPPLSRYLSVSVVAAPAPSISSELPRSGFGCETSCRNGPKCLHFVLLFVGFILLRRYNR